MEILFFGFVIIFFALSFFLYRRSEIKDLRHVYGVLVYKILPKPWKDRLVSEEESKILEDLSSPFSFSKAVYDYSVQKLGTLILILTGGLALSIILASDYVPSKNLGNIIEKPAYKSGSKKERLKYEIRSKAGDKRGFLDLKLEEVMSEDEIMELLETRYEDLLEIILGDNQDSLSISKNLVLKDKPFEENIIVRYRSSNEDILTNAGEIVRDNTELNTDYPVSLDISLEYRDKVLPINLELVIRRENISIDEEKKLINKRLENTHDKVILPDTLLENEGEIAWYSVGKGVSFYQLMASFSLIAIAVFFLYKKDLLLRAENREHSILLDLPELINKLTLLIKAGFTPERAWLIICEDYEKSKVEDRILFEEMLVSRNELLKGISFDEMLLSFGRVSGNHQIISMVSVLSQNMKRGSTILILALEQMGKEAWSMRVQQAKLLGEKASTKLLIPLGISFLVLIIVIMAPLMMNMGM